MTLKRLLSSPVSQAVIAWLLSLYIRLAYLTSQKTHHIHPEARAYVEGRRNALFAFWHGRMMILPCACPPGRKMRVLISEHRDGRLISRVISHFGQATVAGSSSRGARGAANEILRALHAGDNISITPDGPRGPFQVAAQGTTRMAAITGYPVIPVAFSSTKHKRFKSWDKFMLAYPFGRISLVVGAPVFIGGDLSKDMLEAARLDMEKALRQVTREADEHCGVA